MQGSGKDGRVLKDDIIRHSKEQSSVGSKVFESTPVPAAPPVPVKQNVVSTPSVVVVVQAKPARLFADKKEQIKGIRKAMVKTMTNANQIPHFSYCDEYDMTVLVNLRNELKEYGMKRGIKISYMPIIIKVFSCCCWVH